MLIERELFAMLVLAKTEQQLCNWMRCHKSVDHRYTKQVPGAIGVVPPPPPDFLECWFVIFNKVSSRSSLSEYIVKTLSDTNLVASRHIKREKNLLPVK